MKAWQLREIGIGLRNILLGGSLASLSLWRQPRHWAEYVTESLSVLDAMLDRKTLPQRNVTEVFGDSNPVPVILQNPWMGPIAGRTADMVSLCMLCQLTNPRVVFEIGTGAGGTALHLALNSPSDAKVYTLDLPPTGGGATQLSMTSQDLLVMQSSRKGDHYAFSDTTAGHKIQCLFGDSAVFDFSPFYGQVDLFFIDGAHSYEYVRSDSVNAFTCCHPGSVIAWHDFGRRGVNGVTRWLLELSKQMSVYAIPGGSLAYAVVDDPAAVGRAFQPP